MLLSPDAERPSSRWHAHTGARYELSDLREIYGAGTRNSGCSSGLDPPAGGRSPRPSGDVCAKPFLLEASPDTRGVPSSGSGPSQNGTCSGGGIGRKIRAGRINVNYLRFGRDIVCTKYTPGSLHRVKNGFLRDRTPASSRVMVLFIVCEIVYA